MLVVVLNPLCPVRFSLLLYCIYFLLFCFRINYLEFNHWLGVAPNEKVAPNKVKPMLHRGLKHVLKRRSSWIVYRKTLSLEGTNNLIMIRNEMKKNLSQ